MRCKWCGEVYDPRDTIEAEFHTELMCEMEEYPVKPKQEDEDK